MSTLDIERELEQKETRVNAATRSVDLMAEELAVYGYVTPQLWEMVLDEEATYPTELLPAREMAYSVVPRRFRQEGNDLIDKHNQSLVRVVDGGVEHMQRQLELGVPGSVWELRRRHAERRNVDKVLAMPDGSVCVEISASPFDKPKHEREAQHYTDLTMIRASFKGNDSEVQQYNYVLPVSSPKFLQAVQSRLGRPAQEQIIASDELLENPIIQKIDQTPDQAAKELDGLIGAALLEASVGDSAVRMIRKAIENRREAWQFINSPANADIHAELQAAMQEAALLPKPQREQAMSAIRIGYWRALEDRFADRQFMVHEGEILMAAASRAVADADVYIACGITVQAGELTTNTSAPDRLMIAAALLNEVKGNGSCSACGARGLLYGCGVYCQACNKKWCEVYALTGQQLDPKELAYLRYSRGGWRSEEESDQKQLSFFEIITMDLAKYEQERKQKQLIKKKLEAAKKVAMVEP